MPSSFIHVNLKIPIDQKYAMEKDTKLPTKTIKNTANTIKLIENLTYGLEEQIYFLTHPRVNDLTFPCTTYGGYTPGYPCLFPITYWHETYHKCFDICTYNTIFNTYIYNDMYNFS